MAFPPDPPSGAVTFLFTDIEGSTRRWERQPERMRLALDQHNAIVRVAIQVHGGVVFRTAGDAFHAVFTAPLHAVAAAVTAQRSLHEASWDDGIGALRARMAIYAGTAEWRDGDYFGQCLNRVARLLSAGHGGQILLPGPIADLVRESMPSATELRDLGERRLKDLIRSEQVFQVVVHGLPSEFPPLNTLDVRPNNLPAQATALVGREKDIDQVRRQLMRPDVRIITMTGPGGIGKTRLSLQVAADVIDEFEHGVCFVPLASVRDTALVVPTIAQAVDVRQTPERGLVDALKDFLRGKSLLLLLDNFEQVIEAAGEVADLLVVSPRLKLLVTSRALLRLYGEHECPVPPLSLPKPGERLAPTRLTHYDAARLFVERAQATAPDFVVTDANVLPIAEICRRLDGLPLAIELAAARVRILPPPAMLTWLERRLAVFGSGSRDLPARQQTLRRAIDWSYDLLGPDGQRLLRRVSVFVGGFTLEAAEAVCSVGALDLDILEGTGVLVDNSLLRRVQDGAARFALLETIREYALERLAQSDEAEATNRRHASYFVAFAEEASPLLEGAEQSAGFRRLDAELDNLRAALRWLVERGEADSALRLAAALSFFWLMRGYYAEARGWLMACVDLPAAAHSPGLRATALGWAGHIATLLGDNDGGTPLVEEALAVGRELGDTRLVALGTFLLGLNAAWRGDFVPARANLEASLSLTQTRGDRWAGAWVLTYLANVVARQGDLTGAGTLFAESLEIRRAIGDRLGLAASLTGLGEVAQAQRDFARARSLLDESLAIRRESNDRGNLAASLLGRGHVALELADTAEARARFREMLELARDIGDKMRIMHAFEGLACLAAQEGNARRALRLLGQAGPLRKWGGHYSAPGWEALIRRAEESARRGLDEEAVTASWLEGEVADLDQAIVYALIEHISEPEPWSSDA